MCLTLEPSLNSHKIFQFESSRLATHFKNKRSLSAQSKQQKNWRQLHDYSRKRNEKNIYYKNTNNVKRLLQELISIRNAYKMVFFGRGWSPSQPFLSGHAMKGGGALRDQTKTVSRETREEKRVTRVCKQAGYQGKRKGVGG